MVEPFRLVFGKGSFVGPDLGPGAELLQPQQTDKAVSGPSLAGGRIGEVGFVIINRRFFVANQKTVGQPVVEFIRGPGVPVLGMGVACRPGAQVDMQNILRVGGVVRGLFFRRYHVVGRGDDFCHAPCLFLVI